MKKTIRHNYNPHIRYNGYSFSYIKKYIKNVPIIFHAPFISTLVNTNCSFIDIGCGTGLFLLNIILLSSIELTPYGIDKSPEKIKLAKEILPKFSQNFSVNIEPSLNPFDHSIDYVYFTPVHCIRDYLSPLMFDIVDHYYSVYNPKKIIIYWQVDKAPSQNTLIKLYCGFKKKIKNVNLYTDKTHFGIFNTITLKI